MLVQRGSFAADSKTFVPEELARPRRRGRRGRRLPRRLRAGAPLSRDATPWPGEFWIATIQRGIPLPWTATCKSSPTSMCRSAGCWSLVICLRRRHRAGQRLAVVAAPKTDVALVERAGGVAGNLPDGIRLFAAFRGDQRPRTHGLDHVAGREHSPCHDRWDMPRTIAR